MPVGFSVFAGGDVGVVVDVAVVACCSVHPTIYFGDRNGDRNGDLCAGCAICMSHAA